MEIFDIKIDLHLSSHFSKEEAKSPSLSTYIDYMDSHLSLQENPHLSHLDVTDLGKPVQELSEYTGPRELNLAGKNDSLSPAANCAGSNEQELYYNLDLMTDEESSSLAEALTRMPSPEQSLGTSPSSMMTDEVETPKLAPSPGRMNSSINYSPTARVAAPILTGAKKTIASKLKPTIKGISKPPIASRASTSPDKLEGRKEQRKSDHLRRAARMRDEKQALDKRISEIEVTHPQLCTQLDYFNKSAKADAAKDPASKALQKKISSLEKEKSTLKKNASGPANANPRNHAIAERLSKLRKQLDFRTKTLYLGKLETQLKASNP
jgi:hypothetical protein